MMRLDPCVPPSDSVTLTGFRLVVGPSAMIGETLADSVTLPLNPLRLVTRMVEKPEEPCVIVREEGLVVMVKSGGGGGVMVMGMLTECDSLPLVPMTVIV